MGRAWCTCAQRVHAGVWRRIWRILDDCGVGADGIDVRKCRSHMSQREIARLGDEGQLAARLNAVADDYAKAGAALDVGEVGRGQAVKDAAGVVRGALSLTGELAVAARGERSEWPDVTPWPPRRGRGPCGRPAAPRGTAPQLHLCGLGVRKLHVKRSSVGAYSRGHALMATGPWTWCHRCGCHSCVRFVGLLKPCGGAPRSPAYKAILARLRKGRHPRTSEQLVRRPRNVLAAEWPW